MIKNCTIATAVCITVFFTCIGTAIFHGNVEFTKYDSPKMYVLFVGFYIIAHPIIGKFIYEIFSILCKGINVVYNLQGSNRWILNSNEALIFASAWPISGLIGLTVTFIGVILGFLFKKMFNNPNL